MSTVKSCDLNLARKPLPYIFEILHATKKQTFFKHIAETLNKLCDKCHVTPDQVAYKNLCCMYFFKIILIVSWTELFVRKIYMLHHRNMRVRNKS